MRGPPLVAGFGFGGLAWGAERASTPVPPCTSCSPGHANSPSFPPYLPASPDASHTSLPSGQPSVQQAAPCMRVRRIKVCVIDSGIQADHPDLRANVRAVWDATRDAPARTDNDHASHGWGDWGRAAGDEPMACAQHGGTPGTLLMGWRGHSLTHSGPSLHSPSGLPCCPAWLLCARIMACA